jgi:hypothetical protein
VKDVVEAVSVHGAKFAAHPLFSFLRGTTDAPERGLALAPALAHFVMTFADIYRFVLCREPTDDACQALVNAHTREDGDHFKWFLSDLAKLGHDPSLRFSDALRFVWSEDTVQLRRLSYEICRLGLDSSPLHKLVLVQCIESTGSVMLSAVAPLGRAIGARTGQRLTYFGPHHFETESGHTIEQEQSRRFVESIQLDPALGTELRELVSRTFASFTRVAGEMLAFVQSPRELPRG